MSARTPAPPPDWSFEATFDGPVAGIDEAGRGPLAGPVVAAAVILDPATLPAGLRDSKQLAKTTRERLFDAIRAAARAYGIGIASVEEIDHINILEASMLAMRRAVAALAMTPTACLVDGNRDPGTGFLTRTVVGGDRRSLSIAAASILAKVTRDRIMADLALGHPAYGWEKNAGYGVPAHLDSLRLVGVSPHHRRSFAPVHKILLSSHRSRN